MKQSKIAFLTSIGAGLEYYDFVIYIIFASFISPNFFPSSNHTAALFYTFAVFAAGNIMRSIGGIVLGIYGDRFGRKKVFGNTLFWMAGATFLMGITPPFATIGLTATIIFSVCRILQGITCGAEIPGATTLLLEHTHVKRHGLYFGFMISAIGLGASFATLAAWVCTKTLTNEQMFAWGFRLPFLFGGSLALVGFFIRKHIPETPPFLAIKKSTSNSTSIFHPKHYKQILSTLGILLFPACFITFFLALPIYLRDIYHYSFPDIYLAITCGYLWSAVLLPIFGWASDYIGRKKLLFTAAMLFVIFGYPLFSLLRLETRWALFGFIGLGQTIISAMAASYFVLMPQAFPAAIRYAGSAFSYNITYILAALIPLIANYFYQVLKQPNYVVGLLALLALITALSTLTLENKQES